ncbi:unnamed protein product [Ectocarpus sp. 12 AP-2014]
MAGMMGKAMPMARAPHDQMRFGFSSFAQDASAGHPLEAMNKARIPNEFDFKMDLAGKVYGSAFVMRMKTEVATLSQAPHLPGLPSSMLGLETVLGRDETVEFEDYLDPPAERPEGPRFRVHEAMEIQYGLM